MNGLSDFFFIFSLRCQPIVDDETLRRAIKLLPVRESGKFKVAGRSLEAVLPV